MPGATLSKRLPRVVVLVGLQGSGNQSWAARRGPPTLSSDAMRATLADDATNQTIHKQVFRRSGICCGSASLWDGPSPVSMPLT